MTERIPVAIATRLVQSDIRHDAATARDLVFLEALTLLIADLHQKGLTDGLALAELLELRHADPRIAQMSPQAPETAQMFAARIRGAILDPSPPAPDMPAGV